MNRCKQLLCLLLVVSSLFSLFCVNVHASDDENLIDTNLSNWVDYGDESQYFQSANVRYLGNGVNYIEVSGSNKTVLLYDITEFLKIGESYKFSFTLPNTDGVNNVAFNTCQMVWALTDGGGDDAPTVGSSVFELTLNNDNKSKYVGKTTTFEFTYTQGFANTYLCLLVGPGDGLQNYNYLQMYISNIKLERIQSEEEGLLNSIIEWLRDIKNNLTDGFNNLITNIIELPAKIGQALKSLFLPSDDYFTNKIDEMQTELENNLGAVYQVMGILDNFFTGFTAEEYTDVIDVPVLTVDLLGYPFTIGGWSVPLIPDGRLQFLADACRFVVGVLTTFALLYGLRRKYDEIVGGGEN